MSYINDLNLKRLEANAVWLAPSFTHKFDFSSDDQFEAWAKLAFKGARAIVTEAERLEKEARAKDAEEEAKKPKPAPDSPTTPAVDLPGGAT